MSISSFPRKMFCRDSRSAQCSRVTQRIVVLAATTIVCGCSRDIAGVKPRPAATADISLLTPDVAQKLTARGMFALATPDASDELSEAQARAIARAWVRNGLPFVQPRLETQRGSAINAPRLSDCSRIYYGESPYEPLADMTDAGVARRTYGPWWLVPLCAGEEPQVLLGIAAYATDIRVEDGSLRLPKFSGGEFVWRGIAVGADLPISPEAAANAVARSTGSKIASVPRLILPSFRDGSPAAARWLMTLSPAPTVSVKGQSPSSPTDLYMGPVGPGRLEIASLQRASAHQPDDYRVEVWSWARRAVDHIAVLKRKAGVPVRFEPVEARTP